MMKNVYSRQAFRFNFSRYKFTAQDSFMIRYFSNSSMINFYTLKLKKFTSLKERVKLVESNEINDEKEDWGEILALNLEKENTTKFYEHIKYISKKNINLTCSDINKLLSFAYNKNSKVVDKIYNHVIDNSIQLDSISYNYMILSALQFKNFHSAFYFFIEASIFNIPQNLTVIIALYKDLYTFGNEEDREKYSTIIDTHVKKFYSNDVVE
jgi:hypothetical protein